MNATETSQIVHDPDASDALIIRIGELVYDEPQMSRRTELKITLGRILHPFGIHTWVRHKRYDETSDRLVDVGLVCWHCPLGRRG